LAYALEANPEIAGAVAYPSTVVEFNFRRLQVVEGSGGFRDKGLNLPKEIEKAA